MDNKKKKREKPLIVPWVPAPPEKKHLKAFRLLSRGAYTPLFFFMNPESVGNRTLEDNGVIDRYNEHLKQKNPPKPKRQSSGVNESWGQKGFISGWKNYKKNTFG